MLSRSRLKNWTKDIIIIYKIFLLFVIQVFVLVYTDAVSLLLKDKSIALTVGD